MEEKYEEKYVDLRLRNENFTALTSNKILVQKIIQELTETNLTVYFHDSHKTVQFDIVWKNGNQQKKVDEIYDNLDIMKEDDWKKTMLRVLDTRKKD